MAEQQQEDTVVHWLFKSPVDWWFIKEARPYAIGASAIGTGMWITAQNIWISVIIWSFGLCLLLYGIGGLADAVQWLRVKLSARKHASVTKWRYLLTWLPGRVFGALLVGTLAGTLILILIGQALMWLGNEVSVSQLHAWGLELVHISHITNVEPKHNSSTSQSLVPTEGHELAYLLVGALIFAVVLAVTLRIGSKPKKSRMDHALMLIVRLVHPGMDVREAYRYLFVFAVGGVALLLGLFLQWAGLNFTPLLAILAVVFGGVQAAGVLLELPRVKPEALSDRLIEPTKHLLTRLLRIIEELWPPENGSKANVVQTEHDSAADEAPDRGSRKPSAASSGEQDALHDEAPVALHAAILNAPVSSPHPYLDALELRQNLIVASLQLPFWLFFHPSAWRRYVARITPTLQADFALKELTRAHLANSTVRRLLLIGYVVLPATLCLALPVLVILLTELLSGILGTPIVTNFYAILTVTWMGMMFGMALSVMLTVIVSVALGIISIIVSSMAFSLLGSVLDNTEVHTRVTANVIVDDVVVAVAFALVGGVVLGAIVGVTNGARRGLANGVIGGGAIGVSASVMAAVVDTAMYGVAASTTVRVAQMVGGLAFGAAIGVMSSIVGSTSGSTGRNNQSVSYSSIRVVISALVGVLISIIVLGFSVGVLASVLASVPSSVTGGVILGVAGGIAFGLATAIASSVAASVTSGWRRGLITGAVLGVANSVVFGVAFAMQGRVLSNAITAVTLGLLGSLLFALPYALAKRIGGVLAGVIAGVLGSGGSLITILQLTASQPTRELTTVLGLLGILAGLTSIWWLPIVLYPAFTSWNLLLYQIDKRHLGSRLSHLQWHSAFWDQHQHLPLLKLKDYLVLSAEHYPDRGQAAIAYLRTTSQQRAAEAADIELAARRLEQCDNVVAIGNFYRSLATNANRPENSVDRLLQGFNHISELVNDACGTDNASEQRSNLSPAMDCLDDNVRKFTGNNERYAARFRPVAVQWRQVVIDYMKQLLVREQDEGSVPI